MKRIVAVQLPVPIAVEAVLQANPGWGRGFIAGGFEVIVAHSHDIYMQLIAAGAHGLGTGNRSLASMPLAVQNMASTGQVTVSDLIESLFGERLLD